MSQPKRYNFSARIVHIPGGDKEAALHFHYEVNGQFVYYADYAALKAETVKRLEETIPPIEAYIVDLEAENKRLRKAGDDMASKITFDAQMEDEDWGVDTGLPESVKAWQAAKGVQP